MAKFPTSVERSIVVAVPRRRAYDFFADVVGSSPCLPGIESCRRVAADSYRFVYREVSSAGFGMAVRYTLRYRGNGEDSIEFESLAADGDNTDVNGVIRLEAIGRESTRIVLRQTLAPDTPVPRLVQGLIRSFVEREAGHAVERYLEHVKHALEEG